MTEFCNVVLEPLVATQELLAAAASRRPNSCGSKAPATRSR